MGIRRTSWADTAMICCCYVVIVATIASAGLIFDPLPSSLSRPTGQYDTSKTDQLNTTFVDGNVSVSIVNSTVGEPELTKNSSSLSIETPNQNAVTVPSQKDIITGGTDDMEEAASFFRPRGYGGYGGRYGGGFGGGYRRRPWGYGGWGRRRSYGGYGGYGGYYGGHY